MHRSLIAIALFALSLPAWAIDSTLTYQGTLEDAGQAASGSYDLQFSLQDSGGAAIGSALLRDNVNVVGGVFTVELDFGATAFTGPDRFLQIGVRAGTSTGAFTALIPRSKVTPAPYAQVADDALFAASVADNSINSAKVTDNSLTASDLATGSVASSEIVDGSIGATDIAPGTLTGVQVEDGTLTGADIQTGSIGFLQLGTGSVNSAEISDNAILSLDIADGEVRLADIDTSQVQARVSGNCAAGQGIRSIASNGTVVCETPSVWSLGGNAAPVGAFLGTTDAQILRLRSNNRGIARFEYVGAAPNIVLGSASNSITSGAVGGAIGGGGLLNATGSAQANAVTDDFGTIAGGIGNQAGDGMGSTSDSEGATVGGGRSNLARDSDSTVAGGSLNQAAGNSSAVGGGNTNVAFGSAATVSGGFENRAYSEFSVVVGGAFGVADGYAATVAGGQRNCAGGTASFAAGIGAVVRAGTGVRHGVCANSPASTDVDGDEGSFVWNDVTGIDTSFVTTGPNQFLVRAQGGVGINAAPLDPSIELTVTSDADNNDFSSLWLRQKNASASGVLLTAGDASTANNSAFYIDHYNGGLQSRRLALNADGSVVIRSNTAGAAIGAVLPANSGTWSSLSDRNLKTAIVDIDGLDVLERVVAMPISTWSYIAQGEGIRHMGPMAQDFAAAFGLGEDDTRINTVDIDGVALAAIQGLDAKLERENASLREQNGQLQSQLNTLIQRLERLENQR